MRTQHTMHMQIVYIYLQLKTIMDKVLVKRSKQQHEILSRMNEVKRQIRRLENKATMMEKKLTNMEFMDSDEDIKPLVMI